LEIGLFYLPVYSNLKIDIEINRTIGVIFARNAYVLEFHNLILNQRGDFIAM